MYVVILFSCIVYAYVVLIVYCCVVCVVCTDSRPQPFFLASTNIHTITAAVIVCMFVLARKNGCGRLSD